jgi:hypothetical protein
VTELTPVERARRDLLTALVIDFHRNTTIDNSSPTIAFLAERYNIVGQRQLIEGCLGHWEGLGWLSVGRSIGSFDPSQGPSARIKGAHYGDALERLLQWLNGTQFEVSWDYGRILTDATDYSGLAIPTGWMIATFESSAPKPRDRDKHASPAPPIIQNNVTVSPVINKTMGTSDDGATLRSQTRATWLGGWGSMLAAVVAIAALLLALRLAGKI